MTTDKSNHIIRKFDGDDSLSYAVFRKEDVKGLGRGVIFRGEANPLVLGLSRHEANYYKQKFDEKGV